ncbi:divergent polysaccharide deacetylase family protein [Salipaludibacillus sp. HK11]|uniref:divergent polysaccharide deacetylase family protein n=1 Tax=Salipaludibacillus sp. HK11 TaxID=3394320 RepID=UPI0039FCACEC
MLNRSQIYRSTFVMFMTFIYLVAFVFDPSVKASNTLEPERNVAIIIDDFGGVGKGTEAFLDSNIPITVAIMPFLEQSTNIANTANDRGFEVIIHLPMEPKKGKKSWLGPKPITADLSLDEVRNRVEEAIENVPHAKGINQHMGSKIVENEEIITTILEVAKDHNLYFVDSGTNPNSCITSVAEKLGVPSANRDLFLDNTLSSKGHVYEMAIKLADLADKDQTVIGIGHVGIYGLDTFQAIKKAQSYYIKNNIKIVPSSQIIKSEIDKNPENFWLD